MNEAGGKEVGHRTGNKPQKYREQVSICLRKLDIRQEGQHF